MSAPQGKGAWSVPMSAPRLCGFLRKEGHFVKSWKRRWFVLDDDAKLHYFETSPTLDVRGVIPLRDCYTDVADAKGAGAFRLVTKERTWYVKANDEEERAEWIDAIGAQRRAVANGALHRQSDGLHTAAKHLSTPVTERERRTTAIAAGAAKTVQGGGTARTADDVLATCMHTNEEWPVRMGAMLKQGLVNTGWKQRWFVLTHGFLFYLRDKPSVTCKGTIDLTTFRVESAPAAGEDKLHCFRLVDTTRGYGYMLCADTRAAQEQWVAEVRRVVDGRARRTTRPRTRGFSANPLGAERPNSVTSANSAWGSASPVLRKYADGVVTRFARAAHMAGSVEAHIMAADEISGFKESLLSLEGALRGLVARADALAEEHGASEDGTVVGAEAETGAEGPIPAAAATRDSDDSDTDAAPGAEEGEGAGAGADAGAGAGAGARHALPLRGQEAANVFAAAVDELVETVTEELDGLSVRDVQRELSAELERVQARAASLAATLTLQGEEERRTRKDAELAALTKVRRVSAADFGSLHRMHRQSIESAETIARSDRCAGSGDPMFEGLVRELTTMVGDVVSVEARSMLQTSVLDPLRDLLAQLRATEDAKRVNMVQVRELQRHINLAKKREKDEEARAADLQQRIRTQRETVEGLRASVLLARVENVQRETADVFARQITKRTVGAAAARRAPAVAIQYRQALSSVQGLVRRYRKQVTEQRKQRDALGITLESLRQRVDAAESKRELAEATLAALNAEVEEHVMSLWTTREAAPRDD